MLSGSLGIGGGTIYNPLLIELGKHPLVATSSGMFIVMITSISTTVLFIFEGYFIVDYSLTVGAFVVVGSSIGIILQNIIV